MDDIAKNETFRQSKFQFFLQENNSIFFNVVPHVGILRNKLAELDIPEDGGMYTFDTEGTRFFVRSYETHKNNITKTDFDLYYVQDDKTPINVFTSTITKRSNSTNTGYRVRVDSRPSIYITEENIASLYKVIDNWRLTDNVTIDQVEEAINNKQKERRKIVDDTGKEAMSKYRELIEAERNQQKEVKHEAGVPPAQAKTTYSRFR